jgi:hypothetical protein
MVLNALILAQIDFRRGVLDGIEPRRTRRAKRMRRRLPFGSQSFVFGERGLRAKSRSCGPSSSQGRSKFFAVPAGTLPCRATKRNYLGSRHGLLRRFAMPINPYLDGEVFEPEVVDAMARALAAACKALGVRDENVMVRLLAERIIEEAKQGIHGYELLKAAALRGLAPAREH